MRSNTSDTLRYNPVLAVLLLAAALLACKKGSESTEESPKADDAKTAAPAQEEAPLVSKPITAVTKDDLQPLCEKLGWKSSGLTWSDSGAFSSIMASCTKEDPSGLDSPDGKKRAHLTLALFKTDQMATRTSDLDEKGAAYFVDGNHVFAAYLHTKVKSEAEQVLRRILGKSPTTGGTAAVATASAATDTTVDAGTTAGAAFKVGDPVDVEYSGDWWKAEVTKVIDGPQYRIHYVGWDASWDEWVKPARIRPRTAGARTK